jgi:glycerate kinase
MRIVLAPDKFKGSMAAAGVADALADGILAERPDVDAVRLPVADGGDGTVAAALAAGYAPVEVIADGPTGVPHTATYARQGDDAVVELADVCGLALLPPGGLDPLHASTFGLGQVVAHAIDAGARRLLLGIGGSASTDGGAGMVQALGAEMVDASDEPIGRGGAALAALSRLDITALRRRLTGVDVVVASDVDNPLLGPRGAAAIFGPQKGASPREVTQLEQALAVWARAVTEVVGVDYARSPGAGAAGGTGFAAVALMNATMAPGIDVVLDLLGFHDAVVGADLVVAAEGALDAQSLAGKAPMGVANAARRAGAPVVAVAGVSTLTEPQLQRVGIRAVYPLSDLEPDVRRSISDPAPLLRRVGRRIAVEWVPSRAAGPSRSDPRDRSGHGHLS